MLPENANSLPEWSTVRAAVNSAFDAQKARASSDLLSRGDVQPVFAQLTRMGWNVKSQADIVSALLPDNDSLVQQLRSKAGTTFMKKVSAERLIYDRLDRVSQASGGAALIRDLIKLPDGERYARSKPGVAVPNLLDLLPKNASAQTRTIRDYDKPTGKIYTREQFIERLQQAYDQAKAEADAETSTDANRATADR